MRVVLLCGASLPLMTVATLATAQSVSNGTTVAASPNYASGTSAGSLSDGNFNTPTADGRPGVYFFDLGVDAFKKHDYAHAIDMYKVAASWAYKPAEYNLGVMYFKGQGIPVDEARGAAWMILAAERGDHRYVAVRDLMVTELSNVQFAQTDQIWNQLKPTYGDAVALRRAKAQWARARASQTGSRTGSLASDLRVGELPINASPSNIQHTTAAGVLAGGSVDGSLAYRQLVESNNPYATRFDRNRKGTVTIEPLQPIKTDPEAKHPQPNHQRQSAIPAGSPQGA